jgi:hypothetical protein
VVALPIEIGNLKILDFQVVNEPWNEYKLADGTNLRVKVIMSNILKENGDKFSLSHIPVFSVLPNPKYVGSPSAPLKQGETLAMFIEDEDMKFTQLTDFWNEYLIPSEKIRLSVKGVLISASRTNRHDEKGFPIYITNVQLVAKHKKDTK